MSCIISENVGLPSSLPKGPELSFISGILLLRSLKVCFPAVTGLWRLFVPNACLHFVLLIILIIKAIATPRYEKWCTLPFPVNGAELIEHIKS